MDSNEQLPPPSLGLFDFPPPFPDSCSFTEPASPDLPLPDELLLQVINNLVYEQATLFPLLVLNRRFYRILQQRLLRNVKMDNNEIRRRFGGFIEENVKKAMDVRVLQCQDVDLETNPVDLTYFRLLGNLHTLQLTGKLHVLTLPQMSDSLRRLELWHRPTHQAPDFCLASILKIVPHLGSLQNLEELIAESVAFHGLSPDDVPRPLNLRRLHMEYRCFTNPPLDLSGFFSTLASSIEAVEFKTVSPHVHHICPDVTKLLTHFADHITSFKFGSWDTFPQIPYLPRLKKLALVRNSQSDFNGTTDLIEFLNLIPNFCQLSELEGLHVTHDFTIGSVPSEDPQLRLKSLSLDHVLLDYEACRVLFKPSSETLRDLSFSISSFGENLDQCYNFLNFFQNSVHKVAILTFRSPGVAKSFEAPSHHERKILELLAGFKKLKMLLYRTLRPDQFFGDGTSSTLPIFTNLQYLSLFARSVHGRQIDFVSNLVNTFSLAVEGGFFPSLRGFACWGWEEKRFPAYREWFRNRNIKLTAVSRKRVRSQWDDWEKLVESQF